MRHTSTYAAPQFARPMQVRDPGPSLMRLALKINIYILALIAVSYYSPWSAYGGGLLLISYLCMKAFVSPTKTLLLIFGIKLTFDGLWAVDPGGVSEMGLRLTEIFLLPVSIVLLMGAVKYKATRQPIIFLSAVFVMWGVIVMTLNQGPINIPLLIRFSGSFIGLLFGLIFIRNKETFEQVVLLIFISTIIPVFASLMQIIASKMGVSILFYMTDDARNLRLSGLYYDPATTGMMTIISLISATYLILAERFKKRVTSLLILFVSLTYFISLVGGTRSILVTSSAIIVILLLTRFRKMAKIIPLFVLLIVIGQPYLDSLMLKATEEIKGKIDVSQILTEQEYGQIFSGRVSVWQNIWENFNNGSFLQMLFGSGIDSNAHSSYFFLLLFLGWLGLLYYIFFNMLLLREVVRCKLERFYKYISIFCLLSLFLVGIAASTVVYTSFQWIIYLIVGSTLNISTIQVRESARRQFYSRHSQSRKM